MDELFTKYERELVTLRSLCREYAQRYPKVAAQLQLGGDTCDDPHVERLIQGVALLSARVAKRLDDSYPQFTEALLNLLYPHYLRPFPSCAIAQVVGKPGEGDQSGAAPGMPRGTLLESAPVDGVSCKFSTVYDVRPPAVVLCEASFDTAACAPVATLLPEGVSATLTLKFVSAQPGKPLCLAMAGALRLYVDGDASFCAALRDAFFVHTRAAYVQQGDGGPWERLPVVPVRPVGFADDEALIGVDARSHTAYRVLAEYFSFPEKFNFFDIDIPALIARSPADCEHCTLRLAIVDIAQDGDKARMLASLCKQHLLTGCTPVVNLFRQPGVPVDYNQLSADYTLLAHGSHPKAFEVYSVDQVRMVRQCGADAAITEFRPFYSLRHGDESLPGRGHYWLMRHDETLAICSPGHEKSITLVNAHCEPFEVESNFLSIELTCTNRDLACSLRIGAPGGDLTPPGAQRGDVIRLLRRPSRPVRLVNGPGMHWRLISHLALNHHSLMLEGAQALREMLALYDFAPSPVSRRQIGGITDLEHRETTAWIRHKRGSSLVHGTEIRLTLDEEAYAGAGLHLFVQVLDQFFALYVNINSFVELVIQSRQSGKELFRCKPRSGRMNLV
jgi:type VI secretion system protein ImpG